MDYFLALLMNILKRFLYSIMWHSKLSIKKHKEDSGVDSTNIDTIFSVILNNNWNVKKLIKRVLMGGDWEYNSPVVHVSLLRYHSHLSAISVTSIDVQLFKKTLQNVHTILYD